jgi:hypothetical protein
MPPPFDLQDSVLAAWATNSRVSAYLIEHIPTTLWSAVIAGLWQWRTRQREEGAAPRADA